MMSISIITRFYCINFEFSVPRLNWLGTYLLDVHEFSYRAGTRAAQYIISFPTRSQWEKKKTLPIYIF